MTAINSNPPALFQSQAPSVAPNKYSDLTSEDFVKIMFTELSNQDPLKPNDSSQLLQQMSDLRSIQSDLELSNKLTSVVTQNQLATAGALLGKTVYGLTEYGDVAGGIVKSVTRTDDGPVLNLATGERIPFIHIMRMLDTEATAPATTGSNTNTTTTGGNTTTPTNTTPTNTTGTSTTPSPTTNTPPTSADTSADSDSIEP